MSNPNLVEKQALDRERGEVLQQLEDWLEAPMLVLGFTWLALFVIELIWGLNPLLDVVNTTIWIIFILDFLVKFALAPRKLSYIKSNWLTAVSLLLPALRTFRIIRVVIGYGDDIDRAKQLILEAIHSVDTVLKEPAPDALVIELAESTVNIRARWWIKPPRRADDLTSRDRVLSEIKNKLVENGIDLPYPTRQILFHDQTEETDGDRTRQREGWPAGKSSVPKPRSISGSLRRLAELRVQLDDNGQVPSQTAKDS